MYALYHTAHLPNPGKPEPNKTVTARKILAPSGSFDARWAIPVTLNGLTAQSTVPRIASEGPRWLYEMLVLKIAAFESLRGGPQPDEAISTAWMGLLRAVALAMTFSYAVVSPATCELRWTHSVAAMHFTGPTRSG